MPESTPNPVKTKTTTHNDSDRTDKMLEDRAEKDATLSLCSRTVDREKSEPEEALETHEVVELNKFTTKKEWIEEKIKLLESMPPVEVFTAVEALISLKEEIPPGLPTRAQLDKWLEKHDKIEKETEIFDAEDMSKLKELTKAATQRNLSPEDTDLIELTLTTLLALDKLLHLLRDRSEMLDLLGLRLTWEEQRIAAWRERSSILNDLQMFLTTRARWSLDTYDFPSVHTPSPSPALRFTSPSPSPSPRPSPSLSKRRDSTASLMSISSDASLSTAASPAFSRSTRYKLAELLSHDAALFSGRLTALTHGKIMPAGKTLDRLIDASRTPVPDEILDEQDHLEDKGIKDIETTGKFAMNIVMQWKRADEHYNDTKKDQAAAEALVAELANARLHHPTERRDVAFTSRAQALIKRLSVRGDPALSYSSFPRPTHPLFQDQDAFNQEVIATLSTELAEAVKLARQAETTALAYHEELEVVKHAALLRDQMYEFEKQLETLVVNLVQGVHDENGHGDGSPLDLNEETCLDPTRHATFLALLPSVVQQLELLDRASGAALREGKVALLRLKELPGVEAKLKRDLARSIEILESRRSAAKWTKEGVLAKARRLKEARRLLEFLNGVMRVLDDLKKDVIDGLESHKWKVHQIRGAPLTPDTDSPAPSPTPLPMTLTPSTLFQRLDELANCLPIEFESPFTVLAQTLEHPLWIHLQSSSDRVSKHVDTVRHMTRVWDSVLKQAESMLAVTREANDLEGKIETLQAAIDDARQEIFDEHMALEQTAVIEANFGDQANKLQASTRTFTDSLSTRVLFVSRIDETRRIHPRSNSLSTISASIEQHLNSAKESSMTILPFDLSTLDNDIRVEANALALRLSGGMQSVDKKLDYLHLSYLAKIMDVAMECHVRDVKTSEQAFSDIKDSFEFIEKQQPSFNMNLVQQLCSIREQLDLFIQDHHTRMSQSTPPLRQALEALQTARGAHDSPVHGALVAPRVKSVDDVSRRVYFIDETNAQLRLKIMDAERQENVRLHETEERARLERLEGERIEADSVRLKEERMAAEILMRKEKEQLETEEKARQEKGRLDGEERTQSEQKYLQTQKKGAPNEFPQFEEHSPVIENDARREQQDIKPLLEAGLENVAHGYDTRQVKTPSLEQQKHVVKMQATPEEDVFGLQITPSDTPRSKETIDLHSHTMSLRGRLKSLGLSNFVRPSSVTHENDATLPTSCQAADFQSKFSAVVSDSSALPVSVKEDLAINSELRSLRSELDYVSESMHRMIQLGQFTDKVVACDHALSDLLEHVDSYPATPPTQQLSSSHVSDSRLPCEDQLATRLAFTRHLVQEMSRFASFLSEDLRVVAEQKRLQQITTELAEMCDDRINGTRSRPTSSISSARSSIGFAQRKPTLNTQKRCPNASTNPNHRIMSSVHHSTPRPQTHLSNRSVSGPSRFSSLFNTTFASRQRTTSLASIPSTPVKRQMSPVLKPRTLSKRPSSPTSSEMSTHSIASTPSRSTWSRAPRQSFVVTQHFRVSDKTATRKAYVANPKSKLDVAVGNVVNNFKVPVTIHVADDGWRDQSGKYWIGEAEPKLCFCRILRSQTVMVRVGGGWCELSNFLKGHFAELPIEFSPPQKQEERWISSATVLEASDTPASIAISRVLKTPEPQRQIGPLPAIQLTTPTDISPQTMRTSSSPGGSPGLMPFHFMRKAEPGARPVTPSPSKGARSKPASSSTTVTPARTNVWRP